VTEPNGAVLREHAQVSKGVTSFMITRTTQGRVLDTQFHNRLPAGRLIRYFQGRLYVADGSVLRYTPALRYGLHNPSSDYIQFSSDITVVEPVLDGIFVVADKTYFLRGTSPSQFTQIELSDDKGIFGTGTRVQGSLFDPEILGEAAYWYSNRGAVLGLPGGSVRPLMEGTVAFPEYSEGATTMREQNGIRHVVTALQGSGTAAGLAFGDEVSITVKRNGIEIQGG
jgi:hypothetical protein